MGMTHITRNDDPPEQQDALEIQVQGEWFAWDEQNHVYHHAGVGALTEREDGFVFIGDLVPRDEPEYDPESHLREFATQFLLNKSGQTQEPNMALSQQSACRFGR